jgi:hypothetical protein
MGKEPGGRDHSKDMLPERKTEFRSSIDNTENKPFAQFEGSLGQFVARPVPLKTIH